MSRERPKRNVKIQQLSAINGNFDPASFLVMAQFDVDAHADDFVAFLQAQLPQSRFTTAEPPSAEFAGIESEIPEGWQARLVCQVPPRSSFAEILLYFLRWRDSA